MERVRGILLTALAVTVLSAATAFSQEEAGGILTVVPRLDGGITAVPGQNDFGGTFFNYGNTSLYTVLEGELSPSWSFSLINHWIGADWGAAGFRDGVLAPTAGLYAREALRQFIPFSGEGANNFIDCAYITYAPGAFSFSAGKMPMIVGGFDYDDYDFDIHPAATSLFWNSFPVYQYAVSAAWTTPSERTTFTLQGSMNPDNQGLAGGLKVTGTYGPYSLNWSAVLMETVDMLSPASVSLRPILSIGNRLTLKYFTLTLDYLNCCGDPSYETSCIDGHTLLGTVKFTLPDDDRWDISMRSALNFITGEPNVLYPVTSLQGNWFPLRDSKQLRIQACAGFTPRANVFATLGMTWNFEFRLW